MTRPVLARIRARLRYPFRGSRSYTALEAQAHHVAIASFTFSNAAGLACLRAAKGDPVHVVAARAGHDPVVLRRNYAKWTGKADAKVAAMIADVSKGMI